MGPSFRNISEPKKDVPSPASSHTQAKVEEAYALYLKGQLAQAQTLFQEVLNAYPDHSYALHLLGVIAFHAKNYQTAVRLIDRAIISQPDDATFYSNRGNALQKLAQLDAAVASFDKAIALRPDFVDAYYNRGNAMFELTRLDAAVASYDTAIALRPDHNEAIFNKSQALLLRGDLVRGWELFEWRWASEQMKPMKRTFPQPLWLGQESLAGRTILLHSEQGLGDTIQFCRYAKLVSDLGARVILEAPTPLVGLLRPLQGVSAVVAKGSPLPAFEYHCPLLSLPLAFKTTVDSIPCPVPYLRADFSKLTYWASKLGDRQSPRIGLVWSGRSDHKNDRNRSIGLAALLQQLPAGFEYVSLQKDIRDKDQSVLESRPDLLHFGPDLNDFADTAALCELMDVVISVDTSVAHLSGALGKPTWVLLPFTPDWRWLLDRDDSPWYPSVRLYRQPRISDWDSVLKKFKADLALFRR